MRTVNVQTSLGTIPITALPESFARTSRPAVLAITGALSPDHQMSDFPLYGGDAIHGRDSWDGFLATLPGNRSDYLAETSIEAWASAFDEVVEQLNRPVVICGLSTAALLAVAMCRPKAIVAIEPFLSTAKLWPLLPELRKNIGTKDDEMLDVLFGLSATGAVDRDYRYLFEQLAIPTRVIVGDAPLWPVREVAKMPSLLDDDDRSYLAANPLVTLTVVEAGHDVFRKSPRIILGSIYMSVIAHCG